MAGAPTAAFINAPVNRVVPLGVMNLQLTRLKTQCNAALEQSTVRVGGVAQVFPYFADGRMQWVAFEKTKPHGFLRLILILGYHLLLNVPQPLQQLV